jgi:hypothetical protein
MIYSIPKSSKFGLFTKVMKNHASLKKKTFLKLPAENRPKNMRTAIDPRVIIVYGRSSRALFYL